MRNWSWLKHAFAVDPPGPAVPTSDQRAAAEIVCREIVRRRMTTPSLGFLESSRPLNFLGAQVLHFFAPFVEAFTDREGHRHFAAFLEQRGAVEYLCRRIESLEAGAANSGANPREEARITN